MIRFRDFSIKTKLSFLAVTSSAIAIGLCCAGFVSNDVGMIKAAKVEECQALAQVLAFKSTAVLNVHDAKAAGSLLHSLESQPGIDHAALVDAEGKVVAAYDRDPQQPLATRPVAAAGYAFTDFGLEFWHPIMENGRQAGTLLLCANMNGLKSQLYDYGKISLFVMIFALNVVVFFTSWMQKVVARPIIELAETARRISEEGDYGVRSGWDADDEIGGLHMAFNHMLDHIEASDLALQKAHSELEQRVQARTAELRSEITEREKVQAALEEARDVAEKANQSKSEFLANMSHEIRTPLNAVLGFTDLLQMGGDDGDPAKRREYLDLIHTSGEHLLSLINDVLDLSKVESGRMVIERLPCSPQQILADAMSVLRVRAEEKGLALEQHWEQGVPEVVEADAGRVRQLLVNLVSNAIKFTPAGYVRVVGRAVRGTPWVTGRLQLAFDVIDTGVGIPKEKWNDIFDPFVQADNSVTRKFGGTGLGLAICRRIVAAMGGTLTVDSEVDRGSVFTATIEVGEVQGAGSREQGAGSSEVRSVLPAPCSPLSSRGRVLVVEDGDTNRKLIDLILRRAGLDVVTARNGKLGVDAALAGAFDLILMDMQMPVMDGYTATRTLRQHGLRLPIIALTAYALEGDERKCRAAGCSDFIVKPIHADTLLQTVTEAIVQWRREQGAEVRGQRSDLRPQISDLRPLTSSLPTDDPDFREIVEEFVERLHEQMEAMQQALRRGDLGELSRLAHWLKGAGGSAGFAAFTAPARHLETVIKDEQCDEIERAIGELLQITARVVRPSELCHAE